VQPPPADSQVLLQLGEAGMGKSVLLQDAERRARSADMRVLDRVAGLPERQATALLSAFALSPDPVPPGALLTGIAVGRPSRRSSARRRACPLPVVREKAGTNEPVGAAGCSSPKSTYRFSSSLLEKNF
jgi:hypothetical protein